MGKCVARKREFKGKNMADDLESTIEQVAAEPRKATGDGGSIENHSLRDLIAADQHLASKNAMESSVGLGIKMMRIKPPGTVTTVED